MCSLMEIRNDNTGKYFIMNVYGCVSPRLIHRIVSKILSPTGLLRKLGIVDEDDHRIIIIDGVAPGLFVFENVDISSLFSREETLSYAMDVVKDMFSLDPDLSLPIISIVIHVLDIQPLETFRIVPGHSTINEFISSATLFMRYSIEPYRYNTIVELLVPSYAYVYNTTSQRIKPNFKKDLPIRPRVAWRLNNTV